MGITNLLPQLTHVSHNVTFSNKRRIRIPGHYHHHPTNSSSYNNAVVAADCTDTNKNDCTSSSTFTSSSSSSSSSSSLCRRSKKRKIECECHHHQDNRRRQLRVAIDVSAWISSACHGNGAELIDERHFTNYGRAELFREQQQQQQQKQQQQQQSESNQNDKSTNQSNNIDIQQMELIQSFIKRATNSVLRKISSVQECISSDIVIVFDGATPPIKKTCCTNRKNTRNDAAQKRDLYHPLDNNNNNKNNNNNNKNIEHQSLQSSLAKISAAKKAGAHTSELYHTVVSSLLSTLRQSQIPFLVSPYEADGQLAYLSKRGYIDLIISEDSDFIGHAVNMILFKYREEYIPYERYHTICNDVSSNNTTSKNMTSNNMTSNDTTGCTRQKNDTTLTLSTLKRPREARGVLIRRTDLDTMNQSFNLSQFTDVMLSILCVAAGCDYCPNLKGIGIMTARNIVENTFHNNGDRKKSMIQRKQHKKQQHGPTSKPKLEMIFEALFQLSYGNLSLEEKKSYITNFLSALIMFRHPIVFDPIQCELLYANIDHPDDDLVDFPEYASMLKDKNLLNEIVGSLYPKQMTMKVVEGYINPKSWKKYPNITTHEDNNDESMIG